MSGNTPIRAIRIPDELWKPLMEKARERGMDSSAVIRQLIRQWLKEQK